MAQTKHRPNQHVWAPTVAVLRAEVALAAKAELNKYTAVWICDCGAVAVIEPGEQLHTTHTISASEAIKFGQRAQGYA